MGTVYRALQHSIGRPVAIKVIHPRLAKDTQVAKRFLREASSTPSASRHVPMAAQVDPVFFPVSKAIKPTEAEIARNPRARSSVLRHAVRTSTPAREVA